jgi:two-component system LytT family response regulator
MTLRVLIVDDEPLARRGLQLRLMRYSDVEVIAEASNSRDAVAAVNMLKPDLMFLDVQMPGIDGFGLLRRIQVSKIPLIVFVTAYGKYAVDAFAEQALDYLVKPIVGARLAQAIERARIQLAAKDFESRLLGTATSEAARPCEKLAIKSGHKIVRLDSEEITYIEAAGDYMCIHAGGETHTFRGTMSETEKRLDPRSFARVHRSTIVNLSRIKAMRPHLNGEYFLLLDSGQEIKLSRSYKAKIRLLD